MKAKPPKILYLIHTPPPIHGVSVICEQIYLNNFDNLQLNKTCVKLNLSNSFGELRSFSVTKVFRLTGIAFKLLGKLLFFRPQLVYFSIMPVGKGFIKDTLLVLLLKLFRSKIIYHLHNKGIPNYEQKKIYKLLYNFVFKNCSIIHLSDILVRHELKNFRHHHVKIFVVPNGINSIKQYSTHINNPCLTILFFSNLIPEKGYLVCLNSIKNLIRKKHNNIKLIIAGNSTGTAKNSIMDFLENNPEIRKYVEIKGATYGEAKAQLFNTANIFIFPSRFTQECMPLVILEAMSAGLPVIASEIGAIPDMIINRKNGFLIPPGDAIALSEKISFFLLNPELINQYGSESLRLYNEKYTSQHFLRNMENVFNKCLYEN